MTLKLDQVFICTGFWKLYQGVSIGGGIGSISDILDASQMIIENVCILTPAFIFSGCKFYFSLYPYSCIYLFIENFICL